MNWPGTFRAALTFTFDDARDSQAIVGLPLLDSLGVRATFYVVPSAVQRHLDRWKAAVTTGHEIGNHTLTHPCSGNFEFSRANALEDYTISRLAHNIDDASVLIEELLGVRPTTFAYPCGQKFVGRGREVKSYVPLIAERFALGRGFGDEAPNAPAHFDPAQACGVDMDCKTMHDLRPLLDATLNQNGWLILAGHEIAHEPARQVTRIETLESLARFCRDHAIWIDTAESIITHILRERHAQGRTS